MSLAEQYTESDDISALLANTSVTVPPEQREQDRYRTPDYTTLLYPNEPDRGERLMFIHELKRGKDMARIASNPEARAFDDLAQQTLEQAQLALLNHHYLPSVFIMCHVGGYVRLLKYNRSSTPQFGEVVDHPRAVPVYKSKVCMLLNTDATDFSSEFKKWWTTIKNKVSQDLDAPMTATRLRQRTIGVAQQGGDGSQQTENEDGEDIKHAPDDDDEEGERDEWEEWSEEYDSEEDEEDEEGEEKADAIDGSGQQGSHGEDD